MAAPPAVTNRYLEATTNISLKREPARFAYLSSRSGRRREAPAG